MSRNNESQPQPRNLAARMGRWSAAHWKTATFGWLAFVVVAFALGGMVGTKNIDPNAPGPGESGRMDRILDAGFKQPAGESVLIQSRSLRAGDPAFTAAIDDVVAGVSQAGRRPERPLAARPATRARSRRTGTRRSSSSRSAATPTRRSTRSTRSSTASPTLQQAHPELLHRRVRRRERGRRRSRRRSATTWRRPGRSRSRSR